MSRSITQETHARSNATGPADDQRLYGLENHPNHFIQLVNDPKYGNDIREVDARQGIINIDFGEFGYMTLSGGPEVRLPPAGQKRR